tara:strand:+ start:5067 stop:5489 length:423 start_codon:yes stop_codon:yes gene_type:complete
MTMMKKIFLCAMLISLSCSDSVDADLDLCNKCVIIDNTLYNIAKTGDFTVNNVLLNRDFLTIKIGASGCSGNSWKATLIDANQILESNPMQRNIRVIFENNKACFAIFEKEFTFNIKKLKEDESKIILNLENWNTQINYN